MQRRCRSIPGSTVVGWPLAQLGAGAEWNERNFIQDRNDRAVIIRGVARKWDESCTSKKKRRERLSTEHGYFGERSPVMSVNSTRRWIQLLVKTRTDRKSTRLNSSH